MESGHETKESNTKPKRICLVDYAMQNLTEKFNMKTLLLKVDQGDTIKVIGAKTTFGYEEERDIIVTVDDVTQLLSGAWLNVSILQVFMMAVHDRCDDNGVTTIGFMCPDMISATMLFSDADNILLYDTCDGRAKF